MANYELQHEFGEEVLRRMPLDVAIKWIQENLAPEEVYDPVELAAWALDNGFVQRDKE